MVRPVADSGYDTLMKKLKSEHGLDAASYKENFLARRLDSRMSDVGATTYAEYSRVLDKDRAEYPKLLNCIGINVTDFFRDPAAFNALWGALEEVLLQKTEKGQRIVRIWSAGCSEGQEPYTIGIIMREILGEMASDYTISIYATDIDDDAIMKGKAGVYPAGKLKSVSGQFLAKYFSLGDGGYSVKDSVKQMVKFFRHDLLTGNYQENFDLIVCRNLIIYLGKDAQVKIMRNFHKALHPGGYMFLGSSEMVPPQLSGLFEIVDAQSRIYRRR